MDRTYTCLPNEEENSMGVILYNTIYDQSGLGSHPSVKALGGDDTWARPWSIGIHKGRGSFSSIRFSMYIPKAQAFKWRKGFMRERESSENDTKELEQDCIIEGSFWLKCSVLLSVNIERHQILRREMVCWEVWYDKWLEQVRWITLWETYSEGIATGQVGTTSSLNYNNDREQKGRFEGIWKKSQGVWLE